MNPLSTVRDLLAGILAEMRGIELADLRFWHADAARIGLISLLAICIVLVFIRTVRRRVAAKPGIVLPSVLPAVHASPWRGTRHLPLLLAAAGVPCFALALADPFAPLSQRDQLFPGRRICLMLDASSSMVRPFDAPALRSDGISSGATFFTTVAAAQRFVQLRTRGQYRDLLALVEFGDRAYVVTPFTTDYDNVRLSLSLVGDFMEFIRFPDQGTVLTNAVTQGVELFRAFDYLDASGNLMVLFSDGEDSEVIAGSTSVINVVKDAVAAEVPIYFVRTRFNREFGSVVSDAQWKAAVEKTGGRFYAVSNEATLLRAIADIDRQSAGQIEIRQYVSQHPQYRPFALAAAGVWAVAIGLAAGIPYFRSIP